jgi:FeS assembly SUF system protein
MDRTDTAKPRGPIARREDPAGARQAPSCAEAIREKLIEQLRTVFDPEIPVDIYQLGLVYHVGVDDAGAARIQMTLTSPMCPVAEELPIEVEAKARSVEGVSSVRIELVWDPPWNPSMMSEAARLELGMI